MGEQRFNFNKKIKVLQFRKVSILRLVYNRINYLKE
jgi:hypothetical protein